MIAWWAMKSNARTPRTIVPDTIKGLEGLLVARKWDKAAIVYAWTEPDSKAESGRKGGHAKAGSKGKNPPASYSIGEFADLGIASLTDRGTVAAYRAAWAWAIKENKADPVSPGDEIDLQWLFEEKFPPSDPRDGTPERHIGKKHLDVTPEKIATAIKTSPKARKAAREAIKEADKKDWQDRVTEAELETVSRGGKVTEPIEQPADPIADALSAEAHIQQACEHLLEATKDYRRTVEPLISDIVAFGRLPSAHEEQQIQQVKNTLTELVMEIVPLLSISIADVMGDRS